MAQLTVNGQKLTVDDSFLHLSHDEQQSAVDEIASKISTRAPPDKYQQAAIDEQVDLKAKGIDEGAGFTRRLAHGATLGADSTILAGLETPLEMVKHGTLDPREGYNYAKAREDQIMGDARKNTGALGSAAEMLGGAATGGTLAAGGVTAARALAPEAGLVARAAASAVDGAGIGGVSGAMEGNGLQERATNALEGAGLGGAAGGLLPFGFAGLKIAASPVVNKTQAFLNPEGYAQKQVARAIQESGRTPNQISLDTIQAANEGQGGYTIADAMGNSGQRMLSTVARAPGEGRTAAVEALEARQAGQGRRVASTLAEGFDSPQTAAQVEGRLTAARGTQADADYGAVRNGAGQVDVVGTINHIDRTIGTGPGQAVHAPNDGIEATLAGFRERLARVNPDDFEAVARIRGEMADTAQNATQNGYGNRARLIRGAVNRLDTAMEQASPGHLLANRNFAQASRNIEAVGEGRAAAMRGRTEDTIPTFQALNPEGQGAFRSGYVDPLIEQAQGAAFGVNKARPLTSDAFRDEAAVLAPHNEMMQRRLGREMTMFETRNQATGGSRTADNLADADAMGAAPELLGVVGHILHGNMGGAISTALRAGSNFATGNTPAVRQAVADIILQRGGNMNPAALESMVRQVMERVQRVQSTARAISHATRQGATVEAAQQLADR